MKSWTNRVDSLGVAIASGHLLFYFLLYFMLCQFTILKTCSYSETICYKIEHETYKNGKGQCDLCLMTQYCLTMFGEICPLFFKHLLP